jgi:hypothetical protein
MRERKFRGLMQCNPGVTYPNLSREPLGTEGELTEGPDHLNPYRSERERRMVDEIRQQRRERGANSPYQSGAGVAGRQSEPAEVDTAGRDSAPLQSEGSAPELPAGSVDVDVDTADVDWVDTADPEGVSLLDADSVLSDTSVS